MPSPPLDNAHGQWEHDRFVARARALFFARLMFLSLGFLLLEVPAWSDYFNLRSGMALAVYSAMLLYSVINHLVIRHRVIGRSVTYVTLCLDLVMMVVLLAKPEHQGGLQSPFLATQLLFTTLFAILFPRPLAIVPPLLLLPVTTRLDLVLNREISAVEVLTVLWYSALNFIIVYVLIYLNEREAVAQQEIFHLQGELNHLAVVEERTRIAREIHDGLGASLSSLIIQTEYLLQLAQGTPLQSDIRDLKQSAEDAIDELRRNVRMMREDFDLSQAVEDYIASFREKTQLEVELSREGTVPKLAPEVQLALIRILQEALSNCAKHAQARRIQVRLEATGQAVRLLVDDDGKGFDPSQAVPGHYGLLNMKERAAKIRSQLHVESKPGVGTALRLTLPLSSR